MTSSAEFLDHFHRCEPDLRACIGAMVTDYHAREDVFQELSAELWRSFEKFDPTRSFGAWARGIAMRKVLEARRKFARSPMTFPEETLAAILQAFEDEPQDSREEEALEECLQTLPDNSRSILAWRYTEGLRCEVIARRLGTGVKAVHQSLCRLRQSLAACITKRLAVREDSTQFHSTHELRR